ncbi:MAG TPA: hypothetical protein VKR06_18875 [Ktedonosporobacter sp.]|nr:hypothetical protein [Ktedonosporobacter sp.]
MIQRSQETLQAQFAIYDEHLAQTQRTWTDLKEQLARSRASTSGELRNLLVQTCQSYQLLAATPPATCAAEDRGRLRRVKERPLSETEQLVMRAKGRPLTRAVILLLGLVCPILPLLAVRRVRELRLQAFREWTYALHTLEREMGRVEQELRFQKDTDEQRAIRSQLAGVDRTIQQLQLQRDLVQAQIQKQEADSLDSQHGNVRDAQHSQRHANKK